VTTTIIIKTKVISKQYSEIGWYTPIPIPDNNDIAPNTTCKRCAAIYMFITIDPD